MGRNSQPMYVICTPVKPRHNQQLCIEKNKSMGALCALHIGLLARSSPLLSLAIQHKRREKTYPRPRDVALGWWYHRKGRGWYWIVRKGKFTRAILSQIQVQKSISHIGPVTATSYLVIDGLIVRRKKQSLAVRLKKVCQNDRADSQPSARKRRPLSIRSGRW